MQLAPFVERRTFASTDMVGYLIAVKPERRLLSSKINVVEDALKHAGDSVLPNSNRYL